MSVHLSLLSQMKTVSFKIYDLLRLVLLFLVVKSEKRLLLRNRICKFVSKSDVNKSVCQRQTNSQRLTVEMPQRRYRSFDVISRH